MERDCLIAHGMSYFLKQRTMECSDLFNVFVCKECGMMALCKNGVYQCAVCNDKQIAKIQIPYALKLLIQQLMSVNILMRLMVKK